MDREQLKAAPGYFEIPEMFTAFAVGCLDGTARQVALGITQRHYADPTLAGSWYRSLRADLARCRPRLSKNEYSRVMNEAGDLFKSMTKNLKS